MKSSDAEIYLDTCALGYAASVQGGDTAADVERWNGAKAALYDAGVRLAAARGSLDAAERSELTALRRLRDGIIGLRGEVAAGKTATGEPVDRALVVETLDAMLSTTKETPTP